MDPNLAGSKVQFDFVVLKDFLLIVKYTIISLWSIVFLLWNTVSHCKILSFHCEVHCLLILRGFLFMQKYTVFWLWNSVSSWKIFFSMRNTLSSHREVLSSYCELLSPHLERFSFHGAVHCLLIVKNCLLIVKGFLLTEKYMSSPYDRLSSHCLGKPQNIGKLLGKACLQGRLGSCGLSFAREVPPLLFQSHFTFLHSRLQNMLDSHARPATLSSLPSCVMDASVSRTEYSLSFVAVKPETRDCPRTENLGNWFLDVDKSGLLNIDSDWEALMNTNLLYVSVRGCAGATVTNRLANVYGYRR